MSTCGSFLHAIGSPISWVPSQHHFQVSARCGNQGPGSAKDRKQDHSQIHVCEDLPLKGRALSQTVCPLPHTWAPRISTDCRQKSFPRDCSFSQSAHHGRSRWGKLSMNTSADCNKGPLVHPRSHPAKFLPRDNIGNPR